MPKRTAMEASDFDDATSLRPYPDRIGSGKVSLFYLPARLADGLDHRSSPGWFTVRPRPVRTGNAWVPRTGFPNWPPVSAAI